MSLVLQPPVAWLLILRTGAELAITTFLLRVILSVAGVRAQAKLLLNRLEASPRGDRPSGWITAAAGRRSFAINLERRMANQRRADQLSKLQGKAILRRGHFKTD